MNQHFLSLSKSRVSFPNYKTKALWRGKWCWRRQQILISSQFWPKSIKVADTGFLFAELFDLFQSYLQRCGYRGPGGGGFDVRRSQSWASQSGNLIIYDLPGAELWVKAQICPWQDHPCLFHQIVFKAPTWEKKIKSYGSSGSSCVHLSLAGPIN